MDERIATSFVLMVGCCGLSFLSVYFLIMGEGEDLAIIVASLIGLAGILNGIVGFYLYDIWTTYVDSLVTEKKDKTSTAGKVKCDICTFSWLALVSGDPETLECPNCGNMAGWEWTDKDSDNQQNI